MVKEILSQMRAAVHYPLLKEMGFNYWIPRQGALFTSLKPIFSAGCLILLSAPLQSQDHAQHKILAGMLKVLELRLDEYCVASMNAPLLPESFHKFFNTLKQWAPHSLLIMGEPLAQSLTNSMSPLDSLREETKSLKGFEGPVFLTYHPEELYQNPENKKKAFEDLLNLKAKISLMRS